MYIIQSYCGVEGFESIEVVKFKINSNYIYIYKLRKEVICIKQGLNKKFILPIERLRPAVRFMLSEYI